MATPDELEAPNCAAGEHPPHPARRTPPSPLALERAARLFRAAGDVGRLRLLDELMDGERCVTELAEALGANLSTISQQLRTLRVEELVATRREGKHIFYRLADHHVVELVANVLAHTSHGH
jgi:ArsR family transcriptional regulator, lead/cadmium/zinc/bismuth-responsive transcriptional repressor